MNGEMAKRYCPNGLRGELYYRLLRSVGWIDSCFETHIEFIFVCIIAVFNVFLWCDIVTYLLLVT